MHAQFQRCRIANVKGSFCENLIRISWIYNCTTSKRCFQQAHVQRQRISHNIFVYRRSNEVVLSGLFNYKNTISSAALICISIDKIRNERIDKMKYGNNTTIHAKL